MNMSKKPAHCETCVPGCIPHSCVLSCDCPTHGAKSNGHIDHAEPARSPEVSDPLAELVQHQEDKPVDGDA